MTETHSLGEWEEKLVDQIETCLDADAHGSLLPNIMFKDIEHIARRMVPIARELLLAQKEGFRREIEAEIVEEREYDGSEVVSRTDAIIRTYKMAQNTILKKLLTKLDTNGI